MRRIYAYNDGKYSAVNESRAEKPVTKENADYIARKVKAAAGVKVCFDENGNMRRCEDNKLIMRSALNGKRTIEDLAEAAKKLGECSECDKTKKVAECDCKKKPVKESLSDIFNAKDGEGDGEKAPVRESVASRFAKYRKLYEDEILSEKDDEGDGDGEGNDDGGLNFDDLFGNKEPKDDDADGDEGKKGDEDDKKDGENDDEEVPITAIVITITDKDKLDDFKDKLVDAGIDEGDIEIIDGEDDDKEGKVRITVDAFDELKKFLKDEYDMDLEEELGGEVVTDGDDEDGDKKDDEGDDKDGDKKEGDDDNDDFNFDNVDLFGDDGEGDGDDKGGKE